MLSICLTIFMCRSVIYFDLEYPWVLVHLLNLFVWLCWLGRKRYLNTLMFKYSCLKNKLAEQTISHLRCYLKKKKSLHFWKSKYVFLQCLLITPTQALMRILKLLCVRYKRMSCYLFILTIYCHKINNIKRKLLVNNGE
jgi:hypothetical protein